MGGGRPRDTGVEERVVAVAREMLREGGYARFAVDQVADRAGVAKTTVYRRWPSRDHLVVAAVATFLDDVAIEETGDLRADLVRIAAAIATGLGQPGIRLLVSELIAAGARQPDLAASVYQLWARRRAASLDLFAAAVGQGEQADDVEPGLILDQIIGAVYYRALITGDPVDDDYLKRLVSAALAGAGVSSGGLA